GLARVAVLTGSGRTYSINLEGRRGPEGPSRSEGGGIAIAATDAINANVVDASYFQTIGIHLSAGRLFEPNDVEGAPPVVVLNQTAVRLHFPDRSPIGQRVSFSGSQGPWVEVIGVVAVSKYGSLSEAPVPVAYLPLAQNHETGMTLYVRAARIDPASLAGSV